MAPGWCEKQYLANRRGEGHGCGDGNNHVGGHLSFRALKARCGGCTTLPPAVMATLAQCCHFLAFCWKSSGTVSGVKYSLRTSSALTNRTSAAYFFSHCSRQGREGGTSGDQNSPRCRRHLQPLASSRWRGPAGSAERREARRAAGRQVACLHPCARVAAWGAGRPRPGGRTTQERGDTAERAASLAARGFLRVRVGQLLPRLPAEAAGTQGVGRRAGRHAPPRLGSPAGRSPTQV